MHYDDTTNEACEQSQLEKLAFYPSQGLCFPIYQVTHRGRRRFGQGRTDTAQLFNPGLMVGHLSGYGATPVGREEPARKPEQRRQLFATLAIIGFGALAVVALVGVVVKGDRQGQVQLAQRQGQFRALSARPARLQQLWFGPGITDELNRYVRIGQ
jgi:hypothetical protein